MFQLVLGMLAERKMRGEGEGRVVVFCSQEGLEGYEWWLGEGRHGKEVAKGLGVELRGWDDEKGEVEIP